MFKNYIKIAWRNILKRKALSLINVLCLSIGFCFALVIGVYIKQQKNVNQQFKNVDNQYIIKSKWKSKNIGSEITIPAPFAKALKQEFPQFVKNYYRYNPVSNVVSTGDNFFKENIAIGDTTFVTMYGLPVLYGNPAKAFDNINSAVVTASFAKKMFGTQNAIGKTISVQTVVESVKQDYTISCVIKDLPYNSVFNQAYLEGYNIFVPSIGNKYYSNIDPLTGWENTSSIGMIELNDDASPKDLQLISQQILAKHGSKFLKDNLSIEYAPVKDFYLKDNNGSMGRMINLLTMVGIFILFMAIFNFVNISTAISAYRIKEVGLRKVFGGRRMQITIQFLIEGCLLACISGFIAIVVYECTRFYFSQVLDIQLYSINNFTIKQAIMFSFLIIAIGLLASAYPAFIISRTGTAISVKGKQNTTDKNIFFRKTILIIQFSMAIIVFIGTAMVNKQVNYIFNQDTGYNKDQLLIITAFPKRWDSIGVQKIESIKQGLLQLAEVKSGTLSFDIPNRNPVNSAINLYPVTNAANPIVVPAFASDEDYGETFQLHLKSGNFLNYKKNYISGQIVINETAAKLLGLNSDNSIGFKIKAEDGYTYTIAGIIKDYNSSSMRDAITPLAIFHVKDSPGYRFLTLKLTRATAASIGRIKKEWQKLSPGNPFEYSFMEDKFAALYKSELQLKKAAFTATILSLTIVFLGIFGVVSIMLVRREKEIAVRKTLGAGILNIFSLFISEYSWLLLFANLVAWPIAYYFISKWLDGYAYRTKQDVGVYLVVGVSIFVLVFVLVGLRMVKAATANPVKSLRTD